MWGQCGNYWGILATHDQLAQALLPNEVCRAISTRGRTAFSSAYLDTLLLLVPVDEGGEVLAGLASSSAHAAGAAFLPTPRLDYNTEAVDKDTLVAMLAGTSNNAANTALKIRAALSRGKHFVVPLRKRAAADQISKERVSVGRATNKDIVLRDATVSKFHAWFELHDGRDFSVADSGSTNKTHVNGEELKPRRPRPLSEGDRIKFGAVETLLCSAEALWTVVNGEASGAP